MSRQPGAAALAAALVLGLVACAGDVPKSSPERTPESIQADIQALIPARVAQRAAWAVDLQLVFAGLKLPPTTENVCAVLAVTEQESTFNADPPVPNLAKVAREELLRRAGALGVPELAVNLALQLRSPDGRTYDERLREVKTERELSLMYEQFIDEVPLGQRLFANWNPVRTGGPMQVSIAFAEEHVRSHPYPFPALESVRHEVFTRRGGLYFGTAHLLGYATTAYGSAMIYRFADFNAGRYASRNAAFQQALAVASGRSLDLDGDLFVSDAEPSQTEMAARSLGPELGIDERAIRRELERSHGEDFDRSPLVAKVFALAEARSGRAQPRAVLPHIVLKSPKITRRLTTEWFARRVDERFRRCLGGGGA
ncbi:DUF1615 domain-containing protein [Ideonella sp. YS5]|uniref:DUF1615 domain-containing protein n=1 Tax=Ideonella sp. YS5 TaxID=3453714 RepID=UPI003EEA5C35